MGSEKWILLTIFGVAFIVVGASGLATQNRNLNLVHGTGTVKYLSFEGGFYGIVGDDGKHYDPINMPQEFKVEGLRVWLTANITDYMSFHMWGYVVELISIERLP